MRYLFLLFLLLNIQFTSCKKKCETYCGTEEPLEDIGWLRELKETSTDKLKIYKNTFKYKNSDKSSDGFYIESCFDSNCNYTIASIRTCSNESVCSFGGFVGILCNDSFEKTIYRELIYSSY
jgi:hypothetical protein